MQNLKKAEILWFLKNKNFGRIYVCILLMLISFPAFLGITLLKEISRETPLNMRSNDYNLDDTQHSIGQLRRETLRLYILILKPSTEVSTSELSTQLAILESRTTIIQNPAILSTLDPKLIESIGDFRKQWQVIKKYAQDITTQNISKNELKEIEAALTQMELITNSIARDNNTYLKIRQHQLIRSRETFLITLIAFYAVFLIVVISFLTYTIRSTLSQQKTLLSLNISQQRYRKIVETAEEGIWILNSDKDIVFLNSKLMSSLKYPMETIMGNSAYLLCDSLSTKESLEKHFYEVEQYQSAHIDICISNQDHETLWFYINSTLIDLNNEGDQHILSMLTDITKRKRIEDELTKANERLTHQANFDELTQIANRRYFNLYAMKMWRQALSHQTEFSLALIDIDYFKKYNDHYGHLQGDICLFQVAQVISSSAQREDDLAARYGGEEFVLLFPNTSQLEAIKIIENLQSNVAALGVEHRMSLVSDVVTLSIGLVTGIPHENILMEDVLRIADESLYVAKEHGRNQYRTAIF